MAIVPSWGVRGRDDLRAHEQTLQRHSVSRGLAKLIDVAAQKLARLRRLATPLTPTLARIATDKVVETACHRGLNRLVGRIHETIAQDGYG